MKRGPLLFLASFSVLAGCTHTPPAAVATHHTQVSALDECQAQVRQPKLPVNPNDMRVLRRYGAELTACTRRKGQPGTVDPILKVGADGRQSLELRMKVSTQ